MTQPAVIISLRVPHDLYLELNAYAARAFEGKRSIAIRGLLRQGLQAESLTTGVVGGRR